MSYEPTTPPPEYSPSWLYDELARIRRAFDDQEPHIIITPQHTAPEKPREGTVANADGTNWNPGAGAGLYEYVSGGWSKL